MWDRSKLFALWNWLPAFHVVAKTQHLPTASRQLHVSVSALSRTIKQLETALGCELFVRDGRGLALNQHGRALQAIVDRAIGSLIGELDQVTEAGASRLFRVAVAHTVSQRVVVPTMLSALSGVVPSLHGCEDSEAAALTAAGEVELAIVSVPSPSPKLRVQRLGELARGIYAGVGHPLFDAPTSELGRHAFVARRNDEGVGPVSVYVNQEDSALELCLAGQLLAVLPDEVVEHHVMQRRLRRIADADRPLSLFAVRRRDQAASPQLEAVIDAVSARLARPSAIPTRWRLGDELLMRAEYDAALEAWRRAAAAPRLAKSEQAEWGARQLRVAILRRRWADVTALERTRRTWTREARAEVDALSALGECMRGRPQRGEKRLACALALLAECEPTTARRAWIAAHRAEGNLRLVTGDPDAAIRAYEAAEALCASIDDRWERSIALYNLGEAHLLHGNLEHAGMLLDRAADAKLELGDRWGRVWVHHGRAFLHLKRQQPLEAVREASFGLTLAVDIADPKPLAMLYVLIGRAQLLLGDVHEAERAFRFGDRAAERAQTPAERVQAHVGLVDTRLRSGQIKAAAQLGARVRNLARQCGSPHADAAALVACAEMESRRGRRDSAQRLLGEAARKVRDPLEPYGYWFNVAGT
jgi:DNA-binding transcriptional LysR family regulator